MQQTHQVYRSWLAEEGQALAVALDGDPMLPVPSCPGWSLTDLAAHVGSYHRWAADLLQDASQQPRAPYALEPDPGVPLAEWYLASLELLLKAVDTTDPDTPMWTVTVDQTAGAWCRRQAHDLSVHRWDAQNTVGRAQPVRPERATDFIDELFEAVLPYTVPFLGRTFPAASLALQSSDGTYYRHVSGAHRHAGGAAGRPRLTSSLGPADATLTGTPSDLLLTLWRRTDTAIVAGDPVALAALAAWQQAIDG